LIFFTIFAYKSTVIPMSANLGNIRKPTSNSIEKFLVFILH